MTNEKKKALEEIEAKLDAAQKLLGEAIEIANKAGVPFSAGFFGARNSYVPKKFLDEKSDDESLEDYDIYDEGYGGSGWQTSYC